MVSFCRDDKNLEVAVALSRPPSALTTIRVLPYAQDDHRSPRRRNKQTDNNPDQSWVDFGPLIALPQPAVQ